MVAYWRQAGLRLITVSVCLPFSMRLTSVSSLQLHPLLRYLRQRGARCAEAAVQDRGAEGRRGPRQSPQTQNSSSMM
ncbi:hypothetical protein E3U43_013278 [Larimichthys crocea]|uniref:Uncharacterized protein n=1 Tax=Larimichthys crocea TaxID=215358 RepID=A0ACD3R9B7_LARCR|nr:hypothetical protein E3U43_013278 [Larimichthys crocea]